MTFHILVVLYRLSPHESRTLQTLARAARLSSHAVGALTIWDNSPIPCGSEETDALDFGALDVTYVACPENKALSKVYNTVLENVRYDFAIILDQDTDIPVEYFDCCVDQIRQFEGQNLFLPIVKSDGLIVSPGKLMCFKGRHVPDPVLGKRSAERVLAITSGMMISKRYLSRPRFDERLSLYGIDTKFMLDYAEVERSIVVMPFVLQHDTALWSDIDADSMLFRASSLTASWRIVFEGRSFASFMAVLYARWMMIRLAVRYRDSRFLLA